MPQSDVPNDPYYEILWRVGMGLNALDDIIYFPWIIYKKIMFRSRKLKIEQTWGPIHNGFEW